MTLLSEIPFLPAVQEGSEVETVVPMISSSMGVLTVLLAVLGVLFAMNRHPKFKGLFKVLPLLVFCYFVPTLLSNLDVIPRSSKFELRALTATVHTLKCNKSVHRSLPPTVESLTLLNSAHFVNQRILILKFYNFFALSLQSQRTHAHLSR